MRYRLVCSAALFSALNFFPAPISAAPIAACTATFSACQIPENIFLQLPFLAIAGDVIVTEPDSDTVSDVFRIFNNFVDTGLGTGLGDVVFLYSSDDTTPLPNPSTYSANAVRIREDAAGFARFTGNGTDYLLNAPEPSFFGVLGLSIVAVVVQSHRRLRRPWKRRSSVSNPRA